MTGNFTAPNPGDLILLPSQVVDGSGVLTPVTPNFNKSGVLNVADREVAFVWKISDGTETSLEVNLGANTLGGVGFLLVHEGPFDGLDVVGVPTLEGADSGSVEFPQVTTTRPNCLVIGVGFQTDSGLYAGDSAGFGMQPGREEGFTFIGSHLAPGGVGPFIVAAAQVLALPGTLGGEAAPGAKILLSGQAYPAGYDGIIAFYGGGSADFQEIVPTADLQVLAAVPTLDNPTSFTLTLNDRNSVLLPNETALEWAWFDSPSPNAIGSSSLTPTDWGNAELTDGSAVLQVDLQNTLLGSGQTGGLLLTGPSGRSAFYQVVLP
ncbi:MAG: hypothetical protein AAF529_08860 [Pseudomonadota bacterium]